MLLLKRKNSLVAKLYLGSGLGLSLLYGLDSFLLSSGGGGHSRDQAVGQDSVSAGDGGTIVVLAANRGRVDDGVVVGEGKVVVHQRSVVAYSVDKTGFGLSLSSCIGGNS